MKKLILLILFSKIMNCYSQDLATIKEIEIENLEVGKCYFTEILNHSNIQNKEFEKPFILEIREPIFEEVVLIFSIKELKSKINAEGYFRFQTKKHHHKIVLKESDLNGFNTIDNQYAYIYCLAEVPGEWITINKKDLNGDSIEITEFKLIENSKLLKRYVQSKPNKLKENQLFFDGGSWSTPKEVIASTCRGVGGSQLVRKIQKKLIEKGYKLEPNNILNKETKDALNDFQRNNNLKENQVGFDTIKKLGIEY